MSEKMRVLIACEYSGRVRDARKRHGHDAWSCDILPSEAPGNHLQCDVREVLSDGWDLLIAHPPCTYLTYAANRYWDQPGRAELRLAAAAFFMECANAPVARICIENPLGIMGKWWRKHDQIIHPYYFGESALKRTCLWLKNLPPLWWWDKPLSIFTVTATDYPEPVYVDKSGKRRQWTEANHGGHERSKSFVSIAEAMASQWGAS